MSRLCFLAFALLISLSAVLARADDPFSDLPVNRWVPVNASCEGGLKSYAGGCPSGRGWIQLAWDSRRERVVLFGGSGEWYFNDLWLFDPARRRWNLVLQDTRLAGVEKDWGKYPRGRDNHQLVYDAERDVYWMYGGTGGAGFWKFDPKQKHWQRMPGAHDNRALPRATLDPAFAIAQDLRLIVLFGGERHSFERDTWIFRTDEERWQRLSPTASPPARAQTENAMVYDSHRKHFILFGGRSPTRQPLDDTWLFDPDRSEWREARPTSSPPARDQHIMVYDQKNRVAIMWGGSGHSDTWVYDPDRNVWREVVTARGGYSANRARTAGGVYVPGLDVTLFRDLRGNLFAFRLDMSRLDARQPSSAGAEGQSGR